MELRLLKDAIVDHYRDEIHSLYSRSCHYGVFNAGEFDGGVTEIWTSAKGHGLSREFFNSLVEYEINSHYIEDNIAFLNAA